MSWSPDIFIGEFRPWPDSVYVVRGKSDETRRYVPEDFSAISRENVELRELVRHLRECTRHNVCAACEYAGDACDFDHDMRELGIEVDDA